MARVGVEVRPTDGWDSVAETVGLAFGVDFPPDVRDYFGEMFEPKRSLGAYSGELLVGHTGIWSLDLRVPGDQLPTAGITMVAVRPTHRRRGILSRLMRAQLTELHDTAAEPVAALSASEQAIYGRYGYGLASDHVSVSIPRGAALRPVAGVEDVTVEYADIDKTLDVCGDLHDATTADRPGSFPFTQAWRVHESKAPSSWTMGSFPRCVLAERAGETRGYAYYRTRPDMEGQGGTVEVTRVHARDLASYAALWHFLLDQDMMVATVHSAVAHDDPLLSLLVDRDVAKPTVRNGLWVRLVDVDRALASRRYAQPVDLVLDVTDDLCPWNARRWRLSGDRTGATCVPTDDPADLSLDVRELGAAYLGRPSLRAQADAGLVEAGSGEVLDQAARAFVHDRPPHRDTMF